MVDDNPLPDGFWDRHSNPRSGWSRLAATPVLVYALYARRWKLLAATVLFLAVNPVLFRAPESVPEGDFMYRVVRGEELWLDDGRPLFGTGYPEVLNVGSALGSVIAFWSAVKRRPGGTLFGTILLMGGKLGFVRAVARQYDEAVRDGRVDS